MKRILPSLLIIFCLFISGSIKADDILIPFGQNLGSPPSWKYKGGGTNLDAIAWKTLGYAEPGWVTGGSALGFGGGPVRNTTIPTDNSAGGGGGTGARYSTLYFRKTINIPSLAGYTNFELRTQFDDAIVVWINGVEAFRNNIGANPSYATWANGAISNNGNDIYTQSLNNSLFVAGNNIIAVEIHQVNATSSDLFFDLELTGVTATIPDVVIFPFGENFGGAPAWRYKGGGTNLDGIGWKDLGYAEPGWLTGNSALGFGGGPVRNTAIPENTSAGGGGASGSRYPTMYFRKIVNIANPSAYAAIKISSKFDDGIVVWVNGVEAFINNIGSYPAYGDWAPTAIAGNGSVVYDAFVPTSMFVAGNNIIAVEIHQNAPTSSDLFFDMELTGVNSVTAALTRGPYLQLGNQTSITFRWKTDVPTNSRITYGSSFGTYTDTVNDASLTTDHLVTVNGLSPDTKYFYTIGSSTQTLQAAGNNYFLTLPPSNTTRTLRFAAIGDCGNNSSNQVDSKNALLNYIGSNDLDALITLGDNAYSSGLETEFQNNFFNVYQNDLLRFNKLYTTPGNHDYGNSSSNTGVRNNAYYNNFTMPTAGEIGGVPSGTEAYYSFDIGDVHFLSLDSYGRENANTTKMYDTSGAQATWLKNDLAANTKKWTVAYFHHPPYTKTSHNSDYNGGSGELDLVAIRERFIRILERYGVDLVLCGHAHGYERSYLLKNYYNTYASPLDETAFNFASHTATGNNQNGKYDGTGNSCAYAYNSGHYNHGSMYIVAGSAGQVGGSASGYPHNAMYYSNNSNGGSLYFEVDSNRLNVKFVSYTGTGGSVAPLIRDQFTVFKDVNKTQNINVTTGTPSTLTASWRGTYIWPNNGGAVSQSVTVNNSVNGSFVYTVRDNNNCIQDVFNVTVSGPVPITLSSFTANLNNDKVLLNWATSQEQNNRYFTIEKSNDGTNFNFLGNVNGAGTTTAANNYQLIDYTPVEGINYYRLSQTDFDGNIKYHGVKTVNYKNSKGFNTVIRNNGNGKISVVLNSQNTSQVAMKVIDMLGKEILTESFKVNTGSTVKNLNLNSGVYVLVLINSNGEKLTDKIIVH
ncbi:MAG: metallophosphoesterase [Ferruginibacter sp.]